MSAYRKCKNILISFYKNLHFKGFKTITDDRKKELDDIVLKWFSIFHNTDNINDDKNIGFMSRVAWRLICDSHYLGLNTGDEIAYFFVNIVDPELIFLECYEAANSKEELLKFCRMNFQTYDAKMIVVEKYYNERFRIFTPDELWTLERIKKNIE
ncbi:MAG: hypothetical protein E7161_03360 [Firmicutes bacterium]|nr:hypothetical protein [Bacillota bacterium]